METPTLEPRQEAPRKILVADDDDDLRDVLCSILEEEGYEVSPAASGPDLLEQVGDAIIYGPGPVPFDLIITDVRMPGLDGLQALAGLRYVDTRTPVVLITAYDSEDVRAMAERLGAAAVLIKPIDVDYLRRVVHSLLI